MASQHTRVASFDFTVTVAVLFSFSSNAILGFGPNHWLVHCWLVTVGHQENWDSTDPFTKHLSEEVDSASLALGR